MARNNKKTILIIIVVLVLIVAAGIGGVFVYKKYKVAKEEKRATSLGEQIYSQIQNPAEKIPETNPYKAETNPFKNVYKNPFE